jgi:hypothetical protein
MLLSGETVRAMADSRRVGLDPHSLHQPAREWDAVYRRAVVIQRSLYRQQILDADHRHNRVNRVTNGIQPRICAPINGDRCEI